MERINVLALIVLFTLNGCKANLPTKGDHEPTEVISRLSNFTDPPELGAMESINNDIVDSHLEENNPHHSPKIIITYFGKSKVNRTNFSPFTPFHKLFLFFLLNAHRSEMEREYEEKEPKILPRSSVFDHSFITDSKDKIIDVTKNLTKKIKSIVPRENPANSSTLNQTLNMEMPKNVSNSTLDLTSSVQVNLNNNDDSSRPNTINKTEKEIKNIPLFTEEDIQEALNELNNNKEKAVNETETATKIIINNTKLAINLTLENADKPNTTLQNLKDINLSRSLPLIYTQNNSTKQINFEIEKELELKHYVSKFHETNNSSLPPANGTEKNTESTNNAKILNIKIRDVPLTVNSSLIAVLPNYIRILNSKKEQLLPDPEIDDILKNRPRRSHVDKKSDYLSIKREQLSPDPKIVDILKNGSRGSSIEKKSVNSSLTVLFPKVARAAQQEKEILHYPENVELLKNIPRQANIEKESVNSSLKVVLPNVPEIVKEEQILPDQKIADILKNNPRRPRTEKELDNTNSTINIDMSYEMPLKIPQEDIFNISKTNSLILTLTNDTKTANVTVILTEEKPSTNATDSDDLDSIINPILSEFAKQNKLYPNTKSAKSAAASTQLKKLPLIFVTLPTVLCKLLIAFVH